MLDVDDWEIDGWDAIEVAENNDDNNVSSCSVILTITLSVTDGSDAPAS